ncbi:hypothetical protein [Anaerorhabdus sp.]|uniref:hypothetical protein n=1 Tax=Anaerorhabdus sp. TaxID=1872524 RepID=UPI002FC58139
MELSQVYCTLYQMDCLENKTSILYKGVAMSKSGYLSYSDDLGKQEFFYDENTMRIYRNADVQTEVFLNKHKMDKATVKSEYGTLTFDTKVNYFDVHLDSWVIEYSIYSGETCSIHTRIECSILKN